MHGYPQDSILTSVLFFIYINDLLMPLLTQHTIANADVITLVASDVSREQAKERLQFLIYIAFAWTMKNRLRLNAYKCKTTLLSSSKMDKITSSSISLRKGSSYMITSYH